MLELYKLVPKLTVGGLVMSFKGIIVICLLLLLIGSGSIAAAQGGVSINFTFAVSDAEVVSKSIAMAKNVSAFVDSNNNGIIDRVLFDGEEIGTDIDLGNAVGFSFQDESNLVFYPTNIGWLPKSGTYEVIGFIHHWDDTVNRFVALLIHQEENYNTSEGITVYIIDQAGVRVGSLFYSFLEKALLRHTEPYAKWIETGQDFAVGTSPTVSNFILIGKDLGLMDTVLVINLSLVSAAIPPGQDVEIRTSEPAVIQESRGKLGDWNTLTGLDFSGSSTRASALVDGKTVSGKILVDQAQGIAYRDNRQVVFYPSDLTTLPAAPAEGVNWQILGLMHYFDGEGHVNTMMAVLLGQRAGEETTGGAIVRFVDNTGLSVGMPSHQFYPRRSIKLMGSQDKWDTTKYNWALGVPARADNEICIVKDLGITDKILVVIFKWY